MHTTPRPRNHPIAKSYNDLFSFKLKTCGSAFRLINSLHSLLLMWFVLWAAPAVEAQSYVLKEVVIKGGGFVTGIVPHPNVPGVMYCRTDVGGAYRWNPTNNSWVPLQDFLGPTNEEYGLYGVESIALDPQDANRLYMTCGWLGNTRPNEVWSSTNQGASFTRVTAPFTMKANDDGRSNGERLAVDPNLGSTLFNGTRFDGLWKSVNYGASWSKVTSFPVNTTTNQVGLVFVEFIKSSGVNGSATPEIWVGVSQAGDNLYRSTDGGASWSVVSGGATSSYMPHRASQDGLGNMYVAFNDATGPNNVGAGAVRKINLTTLASTNATPPTGQGGFGGVSVDKQHPTTLVVCTMNRWWPHDEVYRSTDGGTTWKALYEGATIDGSSAPWVSGDKATPSVPTWIGDIKIDPFNSDRVYHIGGGGVWSSYNLTATTPTWQFRSDGIEEMGLWQGGGALCSPPSGPLFYCAFGDIGGFAVYDPDFSPTKEDRFSPGYGSHTSVDFAEQNPAIVVRTHYGKMPDNSPARGGRSTDGGKTWTEFPTHPPAAVNDPGVISISANGQRLVWTSKGSAPSYSTDNGATWIPCIGNLTPTNSWELPLLFSDRVNPNKFYLYITSTGVVYRSTDGGASFVAGATVSPGAPNTINVDKAMRTVFGREGDIWIPCIDYDANRAGLWHSTDSGVSFTKVSGIQAAQSIGFGRTASGSGYPVLYMSGQVNNVWGIYRSEDTGANWIRINDNQHQYGMVSQITGDPKIYGRCYFNGRGLIYGDIAFNAAGTLNGSNRTILEATGNSLSYATFASNLATAFANNTGGVWNFDGPSFTAVSGQTIPLKYGASLTNTLTLTLDEGAGGAGINQASVPSEATSGNFVLGLAGTGATRTFIPDKPLLTVGIFNTDRNDASRLPVLTVTYQNNTTASTSGANADNVYFHGLSGTVANPIVSFALSQNNFVRYDDLAFILATPPAPTNLTATSGFGQTTLSWNAVSGASGYTVQRSTVSGGPYTTVTTVTGTSFTDTGLVNNTTYYYVVSSLNGSGNGVNSSQASATTWSTADIGAVGATGSVSASGGTFTVTGSGADIWNGADQFRYVYQPSSGDCEMVAQVTSVQNTNSWAKAGVMIRESTAAGAISVAVFITPGSGVSFQWRTSTGGSTVNTGIGGVTAPRYVRLVRTGNSFAAYYSSNGTSWTQVGSTQTITMASTATIGLAVTSHNNGTLCTSTMTNVTATP